MNNLRKIGLSALAGSLVAFSASAAEAHGFYGSIASQLKHAYCCKYPLKGQHKCKFMADLIWLHRERNTTAY